jgi:secreted Zn-dependent insulinase-like peptidase
LNPIVHGSALAAALGSFYELCVSDALGEYAYNGMLLLVLSFAYPKTMIPLTCFTHIGTADLAGLTYDIKVLPRGVRLTFGGYNDKLNEFAKYICQSLARGATALLPKNDQEFDRYKDQIMRGLSAFDVKQPYVHASYYGQITLQPRRFQFQNNELRDATRKLTLPDLKKYA